MTAKQKFPTGIVVIIAVLLALALFQSTVRADVYNPHPTPPANSITSTMLQNGVVAPNHINEGNTFDFNFVVATSTTVATSTVTGEGMYASSTFTGKESHNGVVYTLPSTQGANGTAMQNDGTGVLTWQPLQSSVIVKTFTAGETLGKGDIVVIGTGAQTTYSSGAQTGTSLHIGSTLSSTSYIAMSTSTPSTNADSIATVVGCFRDNSPTETAAVQVDIEADSAGHPSNTSLGSTTLSFTNANGTALQTFTFSTPVSINTGTTYWVVFSDPTSTGQPQYCANNSSAVPEQQTTNGGTTWGSSTTDGSLGIVYNQTSISKLYEANATNNDFRANGIVGMTEASAARNASVTVDIEGLSTASTTATAGTEYFLSNTNGAMGTSAGTNSRKLGIGMGSLGFLLQPQLP